MLCASLLMWSSVNRMSCPIDTISSQAVIILIQRYYISCRCTFIPGRFVIIWSAILLIWSSVNLILCPIDNISNKTVIILIQWDHILCRCTFVSGRFVNILDCFLQKLSHSNLIWCPIDNISGETVIGLIQRDNIFCRCRSPLDRIYFDQGLVFPSFNPPPPSGKVLFAWRISKK